MLIVTRFLYDVLSPTPDLPTAPFLSLVQLQKLCRLAFTVFSFLPPSYLARSTHETGLPQRYPGEAKNSHTPQTPHHSSMPHHLSPPIPKSPVSPPRYTVLPYFISPTNLTRSADTVTPLIGPHLGDRPLNCCFITQAPNLVFFTATDRLFPLLPPEHIVTVGLGGSGDFTTQGLFEPNCPDPQRIPYSTRLFSLS